MEYLPREQVADELQDSFHRLMDSYGIEDIGVFEEEGENNRYYMGYTIRKNGKTYIIHSPYLKNEHGALTPESSEWTLETDEPNFNDRRGYNSIEEAFQDL